MFKKFLKIFSEKFSYIMNIFYIVVISFELFFVKRKERRIIKPIILKQIAFTGMHGLKIIGIVSLFIGMIVLLLFDSLSKSIVFDKNLLGLIMSNIILQEIAPILTAIIVIGRSATAVAAEIANMNVNNEIMAMESLGIDPLHFLVAPRIIGITVSMFFLVIYFFFIATLGSFIFSKIIFSLGITFEEYIGVIFNEMSAVNIVFSILKSIFFGLFVSGIACYKGLNIEKSINFVPVAITQTVVGSFIAVIILSLYFTVLIFV